MQNMVNFLGEIIGNWFVQSAINSILSHYQKHNTYHPPQLLGL